jgi:integrase/recombinase XerD
MAEIYRFGGSCKKPHLLPRSITNAGEKAVRRFIQFFVANIRNKNTRLAYARAIYQFFDWCEAHSLELHQIAPEFISLYIEHHPASKPTIKQHLAAIRMLFDYLVTGGVLPMNPASSVRGPKYVVKRGKTPVLTADQARHLLDSIQTTAIEDGIEIPLIVGLRDRALIAVMVYTFARVSAVVSMKVEDYYQDGKRWWFRLHEKGGKRHEVPAHHNGEEYMDAYLEAADLWRDKKGPLFRSLNWHRKLTDRPMHRNDMWAMIKRRAKEAGLPESTCCHTFRGTGITAYLDNGGTLENAQAIAAHESPRTTELYDRTADEITVTEVERIAI